MPGPLAKKVLYITPHSTAYGKQLNLEYSRISYGISDKYDTLYACIVAVILEKLAYVLIKFTTFGWRGERPLQTPKNKNAQMFYFITILF